MGFDDLAVLSEEGHHDPPRPQSHPHPAHLRFSGRFEYDSSASGVAGPPVQPDPLPVSHDLLVHPPRTKEE